MTSETEKTDSTKSPSHDRPLANRRIDEVSSGRAESSQCPMCPAGRLQDGTTTLTMERGETTIVFKDVPADVCDVCGEAFLDEDLSAAVYEKAEAAVEEGVQFDVRRWKAPTKTAA